MEVEWGPDPSLAPAGCGGSELLRNPEACRPAHLALHGWVLLAGGPGWAFAGLGESSLTWQAWK